MCDNKVTSLLPPILNPGDAKVAEKVAELGTKSLETLNNLGDYVAWLVGDAPKDFFGLVIGDRLKFARARNLLKIIQRHQEILREREIEGKTEPISPNIAIPLFESAQDENRPELQELWARLIANAMDPSQSSKVRRNIIEAVKAFEPLDAIVLQFYYDIACKTKEARFTTFMEKHSIEPSEFETSAFYLAKHDCLRQNPTIRADARYSPNKFIITGLGSETLRACSLMETELV